jgi:hypothetical protein
MLISLSYRNRKSFSEAVYNHGTKEQSINESSNMLITINFPVNSKKEQVEHITEQSPKTLQSKPKKD